MKGQWIPMKIRFENREIEINSPQDAVDLLQDWPEGKGYLHERAPFWCQRKRRRRTTRVPWSNRRDRHVPRVA